MRGSLDQRAKNALSLWTQCKPDTGTPIRLAPELSLCSGSNCHPGGLTELAPLHHAALARRACGGPASGFHSACLACPPRSAPLRWSSERPAPLTDGRTDGRTSLLDLCFTLAKPLSGRVGRRVNKNPAGVRALASVACLSTPNSFGWATPNSIFRPCPPTNHPSFGRPLRCWTARYRDLPLGFTSRRANPSFVSSSLLCLASASFRPPPSSPSQSLPALASSPPSSTSLAPPGSDQLDRLPCSGLDWALLLFDAPSFHHAHARVNVELPTCRPHSFTSCTPLLHSRHRSCRPPFVFFVLFFFFLSFFSSSISRRTHRPTAASVEYTALEDADTLTYALSTSHRARRIALVRSTASIVLAIEVRYPSTSS
ncbi:uncharacterized protein PAN0_002c1029 [Moesziomyces antarcticus]|uniref:uncharacterized protein n=1 Tax=Pseudozyma antarctica TaxID=84753 RepID=UPI00071950C1|nr:uncharacterized protein PAN0_002c1029 [Moesziomyces antarcticus]GAK62827.1 hypothetical protein PAN0_002c1029 [Moesziomyces antarcticus]